MTSSSLAKRTIQLDRHGIIRQHLGILRKCLNLDLSFTKLGLKLYSRSDMGDRALKKHIKHKLRKLCRSPEYKSDTRVREMCHLNLAKMYSI